MAAGDPAGKPEEGWRVKGRLNLSIVRGVVRPCRSLITLVPCREQLGGEYTNRECPGVCRGLPWLVGFIISWGIFLNSHHTYISQVKIWGLRGQGACSESPRDRRHTKAQDWWPCLQLSLYQSWHYFGFPPGLGSGWNWVGQGSACWVWVRFTQESFRAMGGSSLRLLFLKLPEDLPLSPFAQIFVPAFCENLSFIIWLENLVPWYVIISKCIKGFSLEHVF